MQFSDSDIRIFYAFANVVKKSNSFDDVTIKTISEEVGISRQAMYQSHYRNVNEILNAVYYYVDQDIQNQIQNILDNRHSNTDFIDAIEKVVLPLLYEKRELLQVVFSENLHSTWISFIENRYSELLLPLFRDKVYEGTTIPAISQVKSVIHTFMGLVSIGVRQPVTQNMHDFSATILFALRNSVEALIEN